MRKQKFLICLILIFSIFTSVIPQTAFAYKTESVVCINEQTYDGSSPKTDVLSNYVNVENFKTYIFENCDKLTEKVDISRFNLPFDDDITSAITSLIFYDMVDLFHIGSKINVYSNGIITYLEFEYLCNKESYEAKKIQLTNAIDNYIGDLRGSTLTDVEKALILHDRIAVGCQYDLSEGAFCRTIYGAIVEGYAVCQGYAETYAYLLDELSIKNYMCTSDSLDHAWNIIYIDGKKYHVDITWDDPTEDIYGRVTHDFFLCSTNKLKQTHIASDFDSSPTDTSFDGGIWQKSQTAFSLLGGNIYSLEPDEVVNQTANIKNYHTGEVLYTFTDTWKTDSGRDCPGVYSRLTTDGSYLYFNLKDSVYRFDPLTKEAIKIKDIQTDSKNFYYIYGFVFKDGYFYCKINNSPDFYSYPNSYETSFYYSSSTDKASLSYDAENKVLNITANGTITGQDVYFADIYSVEHIILSNKITRIGFETFKDLTNLKTVVIPSSITQIFDTTFENCPNIETIFFLGTKAQWDATQKPSFSCDVILIDKNKSYLYFIQKPTQLSYFQNDTISTDGALIAAFLKNEIYIGQIPKNSLSTTKATGSGTQKIKVTYKTASNSFNIQVTPLKVTGIKILSSDDIVYCTGQSFDKSRYKVEISYNNAAIETKVMSKLKNLTVSGYSSKAGIQTITIKYQNVKARMTVNVQKHVYDSACLEKCLRCNAKRKNAHKFETNHNKTQHYSFCTICSLKTNYKNHKFKDNVCSVCGYKKKVSKPETKPDNDKQQENKPDPEPEPVKKEFIDVPKNAWYKEYVDFAVENGIFTGTGDNTFAPDNVMTRAQFVQVFANISGINTDKTNVKTKFSDVKSGMWYTPAVKWASENGIVNGTGDGKFAPDSSVTREMMCVILVNYVENFQKKELKKETAKKIFTDDKKISFWAKTEVYKCQRANLISGTGNGSFAPADTATRAVGATIFTDFYKKYMVG